MEIIINALNQDLSQALARVTSALNYLNALPYPSKMLVIGGVAVAILVAHVWLLTRAR